MIFKKLKEFKKEFKKLSKKYRSLSDDFIDLENLLEISPIWDILPENHIVQISWLWEKIEWDFYKVRRFYCKTLKSKSDIRIIYKYSIETDIIEFCEINFIEIYHKNQRSNHDIERIKKHYSK